MQDPNISAKQVGNQMVKDILNPLKRVIRNERIRQIYTGLKDGLLFQAVPYAIPSFIRNGKEEDISAEDIRMEDPKLTYVGVSTITAFMGLLAHVKFYENSPAYLLAIPATTNVISAVYEWARSAKNRVQEECNRQKDLETIANQE